MTTPTYKIQQNGDALIVSSNNEKLLTTTYKRWKFMMSNCKPFIPDHIMDKHNFKTHRFLIISMGEIQKVDVDDKHIYQFKAYTVEVPNSQSILQTLTAISNTYKETK